MKILFIGDIVGSAGRQTVEEVLFSLKEKEKFDLVVANGENAAGGMGITEKIYNELINLGIQVITSGNHIWHHAEILKTIDQCPFLLRPANYPPGVPGQGSLIFQLLSGEKIGLINLEGRVFMKTLDCPFRAADEIIVQMKRETPVIIVDFHAEATSEKIALSKYLDGQVSAVLGTHTHVMTADERILAGGTAFISDIGMVGALESIIGVETQPIINRFLTQLTQRFEPEKNGPMIFNAVVLEIDAVSGRSQAIRRIQEVISL